jgi:hypothetical protein
MSLYNLWCPGTESNCRHEDFQSSALPTELPGLALKERVLNRINLNESSEPSDIFNQTYKHVQKKS